jgi:hypothetical protein
MLFFKAILHAEFEANAPATSHKKPSSAARVNYLTRRSNRKNAPIGADAHRVAEGEAHPENRMTSSNKQNYHFHESQQLVQKLFSYSKK